MQRTSGYVLFALSLIGSAAADDAALPGILSDAPHGSNGSTMSAADLLETEAFVRSERLSRSGVEIYERKKNQSAA
jgi:hypothetical protein